jgi:hypothetical protein
MTLLIILKISIDYTYIINPNAAFINRNMEVF